MKIFILYYKHIISYIIYIFSIKNYLQTIIFLNDISKIKNKKYLIIIIVIIIVINYLMILFMFIYIISVGGFFCNSKY